MRTKQLLFNFIFGIAGVLFLTSFSYAQTNEIPPTNKDEGVKYTDILRAKASIVSMQKNQEAEDFNWIERGPDNAPSRTKALLIDKIDPNIIYAGSATGGLWKMTENASTKPEDHRWQQINIPSEEVLVISCIAQSKAGDIYLGTGESQTFIPTCESTLGGGFSGNGIWKKSAGSETFERLASTWDTPENQEIFMYVNEIAIDPSNDDIIYASTSKGLMYSNNAGTSWSNILTGIVDEEDLAEESLEVKIGIDGTIIAYINNKAYFAEDGNIANIRRISLKKEGDDIKDSIIDKGTGRMEFAFHTTDANYIYCLAVTLSGALKNIYQSVNKGQTWQVIGTETTQFSPFSEGKYCSAISVFPNNPEKVIIGTSSYLYSWEKGDSWIPYSSVGQAYYINQHEILFHPNYPEKAYVYISTDGGVFRSSTALERIQNFNYNLNTTISNTVAFNNDGSLLLTGTQSQGTRRLIELQTSTYSQVYANRNAMYNDFSMVNPDYAFTVDMATENFTQFAVYRVEGGDDVGQISFNQIAQISPAWDIDDLACMSLWEDFNDEKSLEKVKIIAGKDYVVGDTLWVKSLSTGINIKYTFEEDLLTGDSIFIKDLPQAMLALGMDDGVKINIMPLHGNPFTVQDNWFDIIKMNNITAVQFSKDGDILYVGNNKGEVWRCSNILASRKANLMGSNSDDCTVEQLQIADLDRMINSIYVSPKNSNNVVITLGEFGNNDFVYFSNNAGTTTETENNFVLKQGNLPLLPTYTSIINCKEGKENQVLIGNNNGIYVTEDITVASPVWEKANGNIGNTPVFMIRQQTMENVCEEIPYLETGVSNHGSIYVATYGRGVFYSDLYKTAKKEISDDVDNNQEYFNLNIYPNPARDILNINIDLEETSNIQFNIYNIQGQLVKTKSLNNQLKGKINTTLDVNNLESGIYILQSVIKGEIHKSKLVIE